MKNKLAAFERLLNIMDELRENCPWDKKQTFESLRTLTIEETYELAEAIINKNVQEIKNELGDLMLHIVFYSKIASETNNFDIKDVLNAICEKLIFRHPHIYGDIKVKDEDEVKENWEQLKLDEGNKSVLDGVPKSLPAMIKAKRIQEKARSIGFDWEERAQVWDKVEEELKELKAEIHTHPPIRSFFPTGQACQHTVQPTPSYRGDRGDIQKNTKIHSNKNIEDEFGDLFFSLINAARLYNIDPENALERTNHKFIRRFQYLEKKTINKGKSLKNMSLDEMNVYWEQAKKIDD